MKLIWTLILGIAAMAMFSGCGSDGDNTEDVSGGNGIVLTVDRDTVTTSLFDRVKFTVKAGAKEITSSCTITNLTDNKEVTGTSYSSSKEGVYKFVAKYANKTSNEVTVVFIPEQAFVKNVLFLRLTSTSCQACPSFTNNVEYVMKKLGKDADRVKTLSIHGEMTYEDPFQTMDYVYPYMEKWGSYYPNGVFDLDATFNMSNEDVAKEQVEEYLAKEGKVGIAIDSRMDGRKLTVDVNVLSMLEADPGCKIAVALSENYLVADQLSGNTIVKDDIHDKVVRKYLTEMFGDKIEEGKMSLGRTFKKSFTYTLPAEWKEKNMEVTVYVVDGESSLVLNCQTAKVGAKIEYELAD